jgi:hypothetical protein
MAGQRALSLIVLFDRLLIHEFGEGTFRLPDLEKEGIVEIVPADQPPAGVPPLSTTWKKGELDSRGRPPKALLRSLSLVQQFRPLVTIFADEIAVIRGLSTKYNVGVATEHYGKAFRAGAALKGRQLDAICAANRFLILRAAFADGGLRIPRIDSIKEPLPQDNARTVKGFARWPHCRRPNGHS